LSFIAGAIAAAILLRYPLTSCLDYDINLVWALAASVVAAVVAATTLNKREFRSPLLSSSAGAAAGVSLSMGMLVVHLLFGSKCGLKEGLKFFAALPVISSVFSAAFGAFWSTVSDRFWGAVLSVAGIAVWILATAALTVFGTGTFAFNPFFGYFPGPLYDEAIFFPSQLWLYRAFNMVYALGIIGAAQIVWRTKYIEHEEWLPVLSNWSVIAAAICGIISLSLGGLLGFRPSVAHIERQLSATLPFDSGEIHYRPSTKSALLARQLKDDLEYRAYKVSEFLDEAPPSFDCYLYTSSSQKKRLVGAGKTLYVDIQGAKVHLNPFRWPHRLLQHEVTHIASCPFGLKPLGISIRPGLIEGLAVASEGYRGEFSIHEWAKAIMSLKLGRKPTQIMNLGFWRESPQRSYIVAGSFVAFLKDRYGTERLKMAYPFGDFKLTYRKEIAELEREWLDFLEKEVNGPKYLSERAKEKFTRPPIFERSCARETARLQKRASRLASTNPQTASKLMLKAHELSEGNGYLLIRAANYLMLSEEFYQAKELVARTLRQGDLTAEKRARGKILLGDLFVLLEQHRAAQAEYREVPKMAVAPGTRALAQLRYGLGSNASIQRAAVRFLKLNKLSAIAALTEDARGGSRSSAYSAYVVGNWLLGQNELSQASKFLSRAANGISSRNFEIWWRAQRSYGLCQYLRGRLKEAELAFRKMRLHARYSGEKLEAQDLLDRVAWKRSRKNKGQN